MKIIILGAGSTGYSLAEHLSRLSHQVSVIEQNQALCEQVNQKLEVFAIAGAGSSPEALEQAGIKTADMLIAVTPNDEINLLACNFAMQNGVKKRIARVKSNLYTKENSCINLGSLGVTHVIEPEKETVSKIIQYIQLPNALETANFQDNSVYLRGYQITEDMPIAHKTLAEIKTMAKDSPMLFVLIIREEKSISPVGSQKLLPGDKIVAIMPQESFKTFCSLLNHKIAKFKKIIVSGDSLTAIHLTAALKPLCEQLFLVDPNPEHGKFAATMLDKIDVLEGDCTDIGTLQDIHVEHADYFIAAGKDTEDNIMSSLLAKNEGTAHVMAIRNDERYSKLFSSLGIDRIINPQQITFDAIIEKIQAVSIGAHLKLETIDIGIIRLKVVKNSTVAGKPLQELSKLFHQTIILGYIIRENSVIIPDGKTIIKDDDEVVVLCEKKHSKTVKKWFGHR